MRKRDVTGCIILLLYLLVVGLLTGPSLYQLFVGRLPVPKIEWIPFVDTIRVLSDSSTPGFGAFANIVGNVLMFLPLGLLLPLFWKYFGEMHRTVLFGLGLSVSIELIQLVSGGVTSIDDVMLNTLGAALGYMCAYSLMQLFPDWRPRREKRIAWRAPVLCWGLVILLSTASDWLMLH